MAPQFMALFGFCQELGSEHTSLLLHMEVQWLSCGKVLTYIFELCDEVQAILMLQEHEYAQLLADDEWIDKWAYLGLNLCSVLS
jgi:hypothetical protein